MKKLSLLTLVITIFCLAACTSDPKTDSGDQAKKEATNANATTMGSAKTPDEAPRGKINWITLDELEGKMKEEPRKVLVDLYTGWCGWCKRMDKNTFQHGEIAKYVNDNFYAVKFDAETKDKVSFKGSDFEFVQSGRRGTNMFAYKLILGDKPTGRVGYPTIAFLDESLNRIDAFPGYKDASKFDAVAHFISENHYKNQSLAEFQQGFTSPIPPEPRRQPKGKRPPVKIQPQKVPQKNG